MRAVFLITTMLQENVVRHGSRCKT